MDWKPLVRARLAATAQGRRIDDDVIEELAEHLEQRYQDAREDGEDEDAARRAALAELGDAPALAAAMRRSARPRAAAPSPPPEGRPRGLADLRADVRYAWRLLAGSPGFAAAAVLMLAIGIGGTCAVFSTVDAVLLRPLPYPAADRVVAVWETDRVSGTIREPGSVPDFLDLQEQASRLERLGGTIATELTIQPQRAQPGRVPGLLVTRDLLPMLGVQPLAGRLFSAAEHHAAAGDRVLVSARLARQLFGSPAAAVGQTVQLDDQPRTVLGVLPDGADTGVLQWLLAADYARGFADRDARSRVDVWLPLALDPSELPRQTHPLLMLGRMRPGVSVDLAQEELAGIMARLERQYPENGNRGAHVEPFSRVVLGPVRPALAALLIGVALVLLSACVNVANLLLARGTNRLREVAVRTAIGAAPGRLVRQFVVENAVLAGIAVVVGLAVAWSVLHVLVSLAPVDVPRLAQAGLDGRVLLLAFGIAVAVTIAFGLVPVAQTWRLDVQRALAAEGRAGTGARGRARGVLVVAQIALAVVLTVGAGLMIRSLRAVQQVDPGFDAGGVLKAELQLPESRYPRDFRRWPHFVEVHRFNAALLEELRRVPGVQAAAIAANHPLDGGFTNSFTVVGREAEARDWPEIAVRIVSPDYFQTLRVPLVRGRLLTGGDDGQADAVALVNEVAAARFFEALDPIGQRLAFWGTPRRIVGIVGNERIHGVAEPAPPAVYVPVAQNPARGPEVLLVRGSNPDALAPSIRAAVRRIDPALAVFGVEPLAGTLAESQGQRRFLALVLGAFALIALSLAAAGIYAVLSCDVVDRRREIGIRLALGALPNSVRMLVLRRAALLTAAGLTLGAAGSLGLARLIRALLFGVAPGDWATMAGVTAVLAAVALAASYLPARRAVQNDLVLALRDE